VERFWIDPPVGVGNAPFRVFSTLVAEGRVIDIWRFDTVDALLLTRVNAVAVVANVAAGVANIATTEPAEQTPVLTVHATEQLLTVICNPLDASVTNAVSPDNPSFGVIASRFPECVSVTYRLIVSPGAILAIEVSKPPEPVVAVCCNDKVPELTIPPVVFVVLAVKEANTEDETKAVPPITAVAAIATLRARLPAPLLSAIPIVLIILPSFIFH
jgi:hypothetical protein